ncbi:MAG: outer membrane beta-barrel protein, partial [Prevotella sp.]|nr:outer membrane beta-barrel protein [Prevotella sp.]
MKHFMNFKRGAAVLSAIAMAVSVSAQTENYVPKHEFSISGFGGLSTLNYKVNIPQNPYIDGVDRKMGLGGGVGLDWTYHFSKHWGLRLGVQAALYNAKAKKDFTLNGIYMPDQTMIDVDAELQEKQRAVYAQVPLMVQWMTP